MRAYLAAILAAAVVAAAVNADPVVSGETKIKPGKMLSLSVELKPGESALWDVFPPDKLDARTYTIPAEKDAAGKELVPARATINAAALPGAYYVKVTVFRVTGNSIVTDAKMMPVTFEGQKVTPDDGKAKPGPAPKPGPTPKPEPTPPTPEAVPLAFVVVESGVARTPDVAKVMGDLAFWQSLKARGHTYFHYKTTSAAVAELGYLDEMKANNINPPALLIMAPRAGTDTAVIRSCKVLPATTAAIDSEGKRFSSK